MKRYWFGLFTFAFLCVTFVWAQTPNEFKGHDGLIHPAALPSLGLRPDERVVDLAARLRCRECDTKGNAVVSIRWGN